MNREQLQAVLDAQSKPALADAEGMVYQVWEDGEVTLTKSGSLLGQRRLHISEFPCIPTRDDVRCLSWYHRGGAGHYALFTDHAGALAVRDALKAFHEANPLV